MVKYGWNIPKGGFGLGGGYKSPKIDLGLGGKKINKRKAPKTSLKNQVWDKQHGKCYKCKKLLSPTIAEYHHKNGRRSDTRTGNLALVCANCHKEYSNIQRLRRKKKKPTSPWI